MEVVDVQLLGGGKVGFSEQMSFRKQLKVDSVADNQSDWVREF